MRSACVRRLPVLRDGKLSGLVTIDDVVAGLASELWDLREAQRDKVLAARRRGRRRHRREELEGSLEELRGALAHVGSHAKEWLGSEIEMLRKRLGGGDD
jgi:hypothetical protein